MSLPVQAGPEVLVVLASQMQLRPGEFVQDADLRAAEALAVNYFIRRDVSGLDAAQIAALIDPALVAMDRRAVDGHRYGAELFRFVNAPVGAVVVSRTKRGVRYQVGRLSGDYSFVPNRFFDHPHVRSIEWLGELSRGSKLGGNTRYTVRDVVDSTALREIGTLTDLR